MAGQSGAGKDPMKTKKRDWKDGQMGTSKLINDGMKKEGTKDTALREWDVADRTGVLGFGR
jgi:hypothetical protein